MFIRFQDSNYLTKERARFAVDEATVFYPIQQCNTISPSLHYSHIVHIVHTVHTVHIVHTAHIVHTVQIVHTVHIIHTGRMNLVVLTSHASR